ncbi:hypothetical protein [Roseateles amylovorans]|uniref:DUF4156 domain-containing protein n=1 Tax=Roseateles amylovorans TaxID=2978473 RepID=A0ABY6B2H1_9BURK|nr:hypothetical protein [Roseateles amylovorans]UXH79374.1 hypothetical protein N4261_05430 [Roseateles amylovorans]
MTQARFSPVDTDRRDASPTLAPLAASRRFASAGRSASLMLMLAAAALATGCVFAPPSSVQVTSASDVAKMSEQALATCGAGQVKEVNAKSFTCK